MHRNQPPPDKLVPDTALRPEVFAQACASLLNASTDLLREVQREVAGVLADSGELAKVLALHGAERGMVSPALLAASARALADSAATTAARVERWIGTGQPLPDGQGTL